MDKTYHFSESCQQIIMFAQSASWYKSLRPVFEGDILSLGFWLHKLYNFILQPIALVHGWFPTVRRRQRAQPPVRPLLPKTAPRQARHLQRSLLNFGTENIFQAAVFKQFLHAFNRIAPFIQEFFYKSQKFNIVRAVITAGAFGFHRLYLAELSFPKAENMRCDTQIFRYFRNTAKCRFWLIDSHFHPFR